VTSGVRLGRAFGAPVVADASALVLAFVFAAVVVVDLRFSDLGNGRTNWIIAIVAGLAIVGGVVVHELSHAFVAVRRGLHVRAIRVYLFGGYSVIDGSPSAATEAVVSLAGPVSSVALGAAAWVASIVFGADSPVGRALFVLAMANVAIGVFNLIPGFPLDGGRVLRGVLAARGVDRVVATRIVTRVGQWTGYVAIGAGLVLLVRATALGVFVLAIGWFLASAASLAGRREELSATFDGMTVRDAMRPTPDAISGNMTISDLLDRYAIGPRLRSLPVELDGRVVGVIGQDEIDSIAPSRWPSMRARSLMTEIGPGDVVEAREPLETLLLVPAGPARRAVIVEDGVVIGIIEGADLANVLP
jgi:Zn-dependent protease